MTEVACLRAWFELLRFSARPRWQIQADLDVSFLVNTAWRFALYPAKEGILTLAAWPENFRSTFLATLPRLLKIERKHPTSRGYPAVTVEGVLDSLLQICISVDFVILGFRALSFLVSPIVVIILQNRSAR